MSKVVPSLVIAVLVCLASGPLRGQSLVEAAEKAKAERAKGQGWGAPTQRPTVTNADLKDGAAAPAASSAAAPTASPTAPAAGVVVRDEAYWRARARTLAAQLATDRAAVEPLRQRYEELRARYNGMKTAFQQASVGPEMFRVQTELRTVEAQVAKDQQATEGLAEEGRRAAAPPGWFR